MKPSKRTQLELKAIQDLPDSEIDTSEIPEITDWSGAVRGRFYRPLKQPVTIRLDADVIAYFKRLVGGAGRYQTEINRALREWIAARTRAVDPA
jgi:uncharacterized protein (DUF4415 family)